MLSFMRSHQFYSPKFASMSSDWGGNFAYSPEFSSQFIPFIPKVSFLSIFSFSFSRHVHSERAYTNFYADIGLARFSPRNEKYFLFVWNFDDFRARARDFFGRCDVNDNIEIHLKGFCILYKKKFFMCIKSCFLAEADRKFPLRFFNFLLTSRYFFKLIKLTSISIWKIFFSTHSNMKMLKAIFPCTCCKLSISNYFFPHTSRQRENLAQVSMTLPSSPILSAHPYSSPYASTHFTWSSLTP